MNECLTNNGGCSQICINRNGSFLCSCRTGYLLISDNVTCNCKFITLVTLQWMHNVNLYGVVQIICN